MNSYQTNSQMQVTRSRRESHHNSKENRDFFSERQSYIAECKRLLSGLRAPSNQEKVSSTNHTG